MGASLAERLAAKVDRSGGPNACWPFTGHVSKDGYGQIAVGAPFRSITYAHRAAYEIARGPIPKGFVIDHLCRNRACCNPAHMEAVASRVNILRGEGWTAQQARKTHCASGHEFTTENTRTSKQGHRICRECHRQKMARRYAARMQA